MNETDLVSWFESLSDDTKIDIIKQSYIKQLINNNKQLVSFCEDNFANTIHCEYEQIMSDETRTQYKLIYNEINVFFECVLDNKITKAHLQRIKQSIKSEYNIDFVIFVSCTSLIQGSSFFIDFMSMNNKRIPLIMVGRGFEYSLNIKSALNIGSKICNEVALIHNNKDITNNAYTIYDSVAHLTNSLNNIKETLSDSQFQIQTINDFFDKYKSIHHTDIIMSDDDEINKTNILTIARKLCNEMPDFSMDKLVQEIVINIRGITEARTKTIIQRKLGGIRQIKELINNSL